MLFFSACHLAAAQTNDWNTGIGGLAARYSLSSQLGPRNAMRAWTGGVAAQVSQQPVAEGHIVVMSRIINLSNTQGGTDIVAQDLISGAVLWRKQLPVDFQSDWRSRVSSVHWGVVYATRAGNTNKSYLYALRISDGAILWRSQALIDESTTESLVFAPNGDPVVGSMNSITRISVKDGTTVWSTPRTSPTTDGSSVALYGDRVYGWDAGSQGPKVVAYSLTTGARRYESLGIVGGFAQQIGLMVGPDGTVYAPRTQNNPATDFFVAFTDTGSGFAEKWRYPMGYTPFASFGVGPDGSVYTYSRSSPITVVRLDPTTGAVLNTSQPIPADFFQPRMAIDFTGIVYLTNGAFGNGAVYSFNADLSLRWSEQIANVNLGGPTIGSGGYLIVAGTGTDVRAYADPSLTVLPESFQVTKGVLQSGTLSDLLASDDSRVGVQQRAPFSAADPNAQVVFQATTGLLDPYAVRFRVEASTSAAPASALIQRVELFDFAANKWEIVDERPPTGFDTFVGVSRAGAQFIEQASGLMRARISFFDRGSLSPNWVARIDHARWELVTR